MRHLITLFDLSPDDVEQILEIAVRLKARMKNGDRPPLLQGHVLTQVFEKPSLRTRNSFETAMCQLGGSGIFLSSQEAGFNGRESLADIARVLSSYSDVVVLRTFSQSLIEEFAKYSHCPVINGLSDESHPCQALTDLLTIRETFGTVLGKRLAFVGDGNNVARSLAVASAIMGLSLTIASPDGYQLSHEFLDEIRKTYPSLNLNQTDDPVAAVKEADIVYTDVWASMGQEKEAEQRKRVFMPFQVNAELMSHAPAGCRFMHDLPAKRGLEVTDEVIDGTNSLAFQQAENRMHLAKGLFAWLFNVVSI